MDLSVFFPACFLPLCTLVLVDYWYAPNNGSETDTNSQPRGSVILRKFVLGLAILGLLLSWPITPRVSPFPGTLNPSIRPFLPEPSDPRREEVASLLSKQAPKETTTPTDKDPGFLLITGASRGIGRALVVELARRYDKKRFLLTSRNPKSADLLKVQDDLKTYYQVDASIIQEPIDLSKEGHAERLVKITKQQHGHVDVLILNAGIGSNANHVDMTPTQISNMIQLNVQSNTILAALYGKEMQDDQRSSGGRILLLSSIVGAVPGMSSAAMYAATKSYLKSLAWGLAGDLPGVGVTVSMPGATAGTAFGDASGMTDAVVWHYPLLVSNPTDVARYSIDALVRGEIEVFSGRWMDWVYMKFVDPLLPPTFVSWFFGVSWRPWPFSFPPGWQPKSSVSSSKEIASEL